MRTIKKFVKNAIKIHATPFSSWSTFKYLHNFSYKPNTIPRQGATWTHIFIFPLCEHKKEYSASFCVVKWTIKRWFYRQNKNVKMMIKITNINKQKLYLPCAWLTWLMTQNISAKVCSQALRSEEAESAAQRIKIKYEKVSHFIRILLWIFCWLKAPQCYRQ